MTTDGPSRGATARRRLGVTIPLAGSLHAQRQPLQDLVDAGVTDLWTGETNANDGFTPLALASVWCPDAMLGTAVVPAFTRGPACLAQSIAALASAAPGRTVLGLGSSSATIVQDWNAVAFDRPLSRTRDVVRFVRRALNGERIDEDFETFTVRGFRLEQPPRIVVAALRTVPRSASLSSCATCS